MNGTSENPQFLSRGIDYLGILGAKLRDLQGFATLVFELIQNADDADGASSMSFDIGQDALIVDNDGVFSACDQPEADECQWETVKSHLCDFHRFRRVGRGDKREQAGTTGAFGIGFIAVYQVTDHPELISSGRHWTIHEEKSENKRIEVCRGCKQCQDPDLPGTRFILPWARIPHSELRKRLRAEPVTEKETREFLAELTSSLPTAMLFLKRLNLIRVTKDWRPIMRFERIVSDDSLIINDGKYDQIWHLLRGHFNDDAKALREKHSGRIETKRSAEVTLAIPSESLNVGHFCAFLPTQHETGLPFHINADFFPTNDRKRIVLESDYQSEWNRAAIRAASKAFNDRFESLRGLLDHKRVWQIIESVHRVYENAQRGHHEESLASFWECLSPKLRELPIVFTTRKEWRPISEVVLLEKEEEEETVPLLEKLGLQVVHHDLRSYFNLLRNKETMGVQFLDLFHLTHALKQLGLTKRTEPTALPKFLRNVSDLRILWRGLDRLFKRQRKQEEQQKVSEELAKCAIVLGRDKALWPCNELFRADKQTIALFSEIDRRIPFIADHGLENDTIRQLCPEFSIGSAIRILARLLNNPNDVHKNIDPTRLLKWFESRRVNFQSFPQLKQELATLPIFPSSDGLQALSNLSLPGNFSDPIGFANLVDTQKLNPRLELFLKELGAKELTFRTYATVQIPQAFADLRLPPEKKRQTIQLLAKRFYEIGDDDELRLRLAEVAIVECDDGDFHKPGEVYFRSDITSEVLGQDIHFATIPRENGDAVREFYAWLGIEHEPRIEQILSRIEVLTSQTPNRDSVRAIQIIFRHLGERLKRTKMGSELLAPLQSKAWLPTRNRLERWYRPDELYTIFQEYLFESQANFLGVDREVQTASPELLRFLDIKTVPRIPQVVEHLLTCSRTGKAVNKEVYRFLNDNAHDPVIKQRLKGQPCLLLPNNNYVKASQVFWGEHPCGSFRYQLGAELRSYGDLFSVLGVREQPGHGDAIQVICEIAEKYGGVNTPLDDDAYNVLMKCWGMLEKALESEVITANDLNGLKSKKVVANASRLLYLPECMYFEDRAGLAAKFDGFLQHNIIPRPHGAWRAMAAAGVRALTSAVASELLECPDPVDDQLLPRRIQERRSQLARVLETKPIGTESVSTLPQLGQLRYQKVSGLKIRYSLKAFNRTLFSHPEEVPAHLRRDENALYYVQLNGKLPWPSIAREFALFLAPDSEVGPLASGIKEVLGAATEQDARSVLDELGFAEVETLSTEIPPRGEFIDSLGGENVSTEIEEPIDSDSLSQDGNPPAEPPSSADDAGIRILEPDPPPPSVSPETLQGDAETVFPENGKQRSASSGHGHKETGKRPPSEGQSRLRTYVDYKTENGHSPVSDLFAQRSAIDQAGIKSVIADENKRGRAVKEMPVNNPGYDLESSDGSGEVIRYIEVKSLSGAWGVKGISLTRTQFEKAREIGEHYWLYVVEWAGQNEKCQIHRIQNPANQVNQFLYDSGWKELAVITTKTEID